MLDFVFPRRCPFCDGIVRFGDMVCDRCRSSIPYIGEEYCLKCGKALLKTDSEYCSDCMHTEHLFTRGRAVYVYEGSVRASIGRFKFRGRQEYADFYGRDMVRHLGSFIKKCRIDIIIPVPISKEKQKMRGYNQAELIAERISALTGLPFDGMLVKRVRNTPPMKDLTRSERMKNLIGAFKITSHDVKWRNVLIVDDIYTTGSTIDAMAAEIKNAGAEKVFFVALASGAPA